jgi:hypothetical protein
MAGRPPLLTPDVIQRAGELRDAGAGIAEIGAQLGVSRRSTFRALARTRGERVDLAAREPPAGPLSEADLVALLERQARRGNVRAIDLLLRRPTPRNRVHHGRCAAFSPGPRYQDTPRLAGNGGPGGGGDCAGAAG